MTGARLRRWLFADQLGPHFLDSDDQPVLLAEARSVFRRRSFHRQKAHLVLSALRHRAAELGERARFVRGETYRGALGALGERVSVCAPTSHAADRFVRGLDGVEVLPARGFTLSRRDFADWADGRRRLLLEDFYREQRRRHGVLMEGDEPVTGRWNYDADNRERPPRRASRLGVVPAWQPDEDEIDEQVRRDLDEWEADGSIRTVGRDGPRRFAVTRARRWPRFGTSSSIGCLPSARSRTRCSPATRRWHIRCCRHRSTWACSTRWNASGPPKRLT